jgi:hypothetical protein
VTVPGAPLGPSSVTGLSVKMAAEDGQPRRNEINFGSHPYR